MLMKTAIQNHYPQEETFEQFMASLKEIREMNRETAERQKEYEKQRKHFRKVFSEEYASNYSAYREYVRAYEIGDLLRHFKQGIRLAQIGLTPHEVDRIQSISGVQFMSGFSDDGQDLRRNDVDVLIICNRGKFNHINTKVEAKNGNTNRLIDLEEFLCTFEPARIYAERNIAKELLA